jgi:rhamnogalacturonan endolyase
MPNILTFSIALAFLLGMEHVGIFKVLYNAPSDTLIYENKTLSPWAHLGLWWDGDDTVELYNDGKIEKWNPVMPATSSELPRILTISSYGAVNPGDPNPGFLSDIFGY